MQEHVVAKVDAAMALAIEPEAKTRAKNSAAKMWRRVLELASADREVQLYQ
jgi:hypothetical protein